jgi:hypothetical protein
MARRDYWSRPIQSDRMLHDYGNTRLTPEYRDQLRRDLWLVPLVIGLSLAGMMAMVAVGVLR